MPADPLQRKQISLERLKNLRSNLREAYKKSKGEELPYAKNKTNPFYIELIEDISKKTGMNEISKGTIQKFLFNDDNRNYQIYSLQLIEKYVCIVMGSNTDIMERKVIESESLEVNHNPEIKLFAKRIYIELITRKIAIPIDEDNDVIEEVYNSWYKFFCIIRDELKTLPANCLKDISNPKSLIGLSNRILNEVLRPHLTKYQAKYRKWLEKAKQNPEYENFTPQELQKKYPNYEALMKSLKEANKMLSEIMKEFTAFLN